MPYSNREKRLKYHQKYNKKFFKAYYRKNRAKQILKNKKWRDTHPAQWKIKIRDYRRKLKLIVIMAYGGKCEICNESHVECLTIDHINNDGANQRKNFGQISRGHGGGGYKFYRFLVINNFPKDLGLRVLCFNCNCSRGVYGYSPYEKHIKDKINWSVYV